MDTEIKKEECCWCKLKFNANELYKIEIHHSPINLYICQTCLMNNPGFSFPVKLENALTRILRIYK